MLRAACRKAMPSTRPGIMSGELMKVAMASPPGTSRRTTAMAHSVPSTSDTHVEMNATWADSQAEASKPSALRIAEYHLSEKPCGGNEKTADSVTDTARTIRIGMKRKTRTKPSITQQPANDTRAITTPSLRG